VALKDTIGVTSGQGAQKSTNYQPVFEIVGWAGRPADLVHKPKMRSGATATRTEAPEPFSSSATPPSTGSTKVEPPAAKAPEAKPEPAMAGTDDDFG